MSRRRSASLSRPVFQADSPSFEHPAQNDLKALALAGSTDGRPRSRSRANSDSAPVDVSTARVSLQEACQVITFSEEQRPVVQVRKAKPSSTPSRLALLPTGRPTPRRAITRMVPDDSVSMDVNPLELPAFRAGLLAAGYKQPLDTSRKAIRGRFVHALEKQEFKAHLDSFLDEKRLRPLGEYMIRFHGSPAESYSPFVHIFTTSLPSTLRVFVDSPQAESIEATTTWTFLPHSLIGESLWACKAKKFWPVRVVFEGPKEGDVVPNAVDERETKKRSKKSHIEFGAAEELKKEADELDKNTKQNSLRASELPPDLKLDTSVKPAPSPSSSRRNRHAEDEVVSPSTPTIVESVRQLGQSVVATVQPVLTTRLEDLKSWWQQQQSSRHEEDYAIDDERERRRRRREERERRRQREAEGAEVGDGRQSRRQADDDAIDTAEVERMAEEEERLEKAERRKRREERRRREGE